MLGDEDTAKILAACDGDDFSSLRDRAIIRIFHSTGARLSEVAQLQLDDVDMGNGALLLRGKTVRSRCVRLGPLAGETLSRYLQMRGGQAASLHTAVWLTARGDVPMSSIDVKLMLRRRGRLAGVGAVHAHRWRQNLMNSWHLAGGGTSDLMMIGCSAPGIARSDDESGDAGRANRLT